MPIYNDNQVPLNYETIMGAGNPIRELARAKCQIAIRSNIAGWQYNNWRDGGGWELLPNQQFYEPTICVRSFTMIRLSGSVYEDWATIKYDAPGYGPDWQPTNCYQIAIANTLRTGVMYHKQITKIWFGECDFNYLYLDG